MRKLIFKANSSVPEEGVNFVIRYTGGYWNDYGYKTIYGIFVPTTSSSGNICLCEIGWVKFMSTIGGKASYALLGLGDQKWTELPHDIIGVSRDPKLYEWLSSHLTTEQCIDFVQSLHLILDDGVFYRQVEGTSCFIYSLNRDMSTANLFNHLSKFKRMIIPENMTIGFRTIYEKKQEELLREMEIESDCFYAKYTNGYLEQIMVAGDKNNKDYGRLLVNPQTGENIRISLNQEESRHFQDGSYYKVRIKVASVKERETAQNPYLFYIDSDYEEVPNPYEAIVRKQFAQHDSPASNKNLVGSIKEWTASLYTNKARMFYELLQNADDASSNDGVQVNVQVNEDFFIITHNGFAFNYLDFGAINSTAISTKSKKQGKTGYKGIGFKSVFTKETNTVYIKTGGFFFRYDKLYELYNDFDAFYREVRNLKNETQEEEFFEKFFEQRKEFHGTEDIPWHILPIWCDVMPSAFLDTIFSTGENVSIAIKYNNDISEICNQVENLLSRPQFLLFVRHINHIKYHNSNQSVELQRIEQDGLVSIYSSDEERNSEYSYIVSESESINLDDQTFQNCGINIQRGIKTDKEGHEIKILQKITSDGLSIELDLPERIAASESTQISFAVAVKDGDVLPMRDGNTLFAYLPMQEPSYQFKLFVNADFDPSSDRERVKEDSYWNYFLFYNIGLQIVKTVSMLASKQYHNYLQVLPEKLLYDNDLQKHFNRGYLQAIRGEKFILDSQENVVGQDQIVVDLSGLSDILGCDMFEKLLGITNKHLPNPNIGGSILKTKTKIQKKEGEGYETRYIFDKIEFKDDQDVLDAISNHISDINVWLVSASQSEKECLFKWLSTKSQTREFLDKCKKIANELNIFSFGDVLVSVDTCSTKDDCLILCDQLVGVQGIVMKLGFSVTNENISHHSLNSLLKIPSGLDVLNKFSKKLDAIVDTKPYPLSGPEKRELLHACVELAGKDTDAVKKMVILNNKEGDPTSLLQLCKTDKIYLSAYAISEEEYGEEIANLLVPKDKILVSIIKNHITDIIDKDNIAYVYHDFHEQNWDESFWKEMIERLSPECVAQIITKAPDDIKISFISEIPRIDLDRSNYAENDWEYICYKVAQQIDKASLLENCTEKLLGRTYIEDVAVCAPYSNKCKIEIDDETKIELSLSDILPQQNTAIIDKFRGKLPFVAIPLREMSPYKISDTIIHDFEGGADLTPPQYIFLQLYKKSNSYNSYIDKRILASKMDVVMKNFFMKHIDVCLDYCLNNKIIEDIFSPLDGKYFAEYKDLLLPEEILPSEVMAWAERGDSSARTSMLQSMGVRSNDSDLIKTRKAWLNDAQDIENTDFSSETLSWIYEQKELLNDIEVHPNRLQLLTKILYSRNKEYCRIAQQLLSDGSYEWEDENYSDWVSERNNSIFICPDGIPIELYNQDRVFCVVHDSPDTYYYDSSVNRIYISGKQQPKDILKKAAFADDFSQFTTVDWYSLFFHSDTEVLELKNQLLEAEKKNQELERQNNDLQNENMQLQERLSQLVNRLQNVSLKFENDDSIEKQEQIAQSKIACKLVLDHLHKDFNFTVPPMREDFCGVINGVIDLDGIERPLVVISSQSPKRKDGKDLYHLHLNNTEWRQLLRENSMLWIRAENNILIPIHRDELITYYDKATLSWDTSNIMDDVRVEQIMTVMQFFKQVHLDVAVVDPDKTRGDLLAEFGF